MRQIGSLPTQDQAEIFVDYLLTEGIAAKADSEGDTWAIWVKDENHVETARNHFERFLQDPRAIDTSEVRKIARTTRLQAQRQRQQVKQNTISVRGHWTGPMSRRAPVIFGLICISVVLFILCEMGMSDRNNEYVRGLSFNRTFPGSPFASVHRGEIWRLITPIFLHANAMHLIFNMIGMQWLGTQIESKRGSLFIILLVVLIAVVSNVAQAYFVGPGFGGMSGVVYGLFGYIFMRRDDGYMMSSTMVGYMFLIFALGFFGIPQPNIANFAHGGGLLAGIFVGAIRQFFPR